MARHETMRAAMEAGDELAEVEIRYQLLAEVFDEMPQLRANLNPQLERAKAEIVRLRALSSGKSRRGRVASVTPFDAGRFDKAGS